MLVEQEENMQIELLTPLTAEFIPDESDWDGLEEEDGVWSQDSDSQSLDGADLVQYKEAIQDMVDKENSFGSEDGKPCNLMQPSHKRKGGKRCSVCKGSRSCSVRMRHAPAQRPSAIE